MVSITLTRILPAPPSRVYGVLADYREHHPRILPKPEFESLVVERGGAGAGTVVRVTMRVMGARSSSRLVVTEPEPGRVLREAEEGGAFVTTFTVEPADGGARCRVTIATEWARRPGLRGLVERVVNPLVARRLYARELDLLADYSGGATVPPMPSRSA